MEVRNTFTYGWSHETHVWELYRENGQGVMLRVERVQYASWKEAAGWKWTLWQVGGDTIDNSPYDENGFTNPMDAFAAGCDAYYAWDFIQRHPEALAEF